MDYTEFTKVLIADDIPMVRMSMRHMCQKVNKTWTVDEAQSGEECIEMATGSKQYDLIIIARRSSAEHLITTKALRLHSYGLDSHCR